MLNTLRTCARAHYLAFGQSFYAIISRPLVSTMTIMVIAIALTLPSLGWIFVDKIKASPLTQHIGHLTLYLKPSARATGDAQASLLTVQQIPGVSHAELKTGEQALSELQQQEGMQDIMRYLPENPLPSIIDVSLDSAVNTPLKIQELVTRLGELQSIEQVQLNQEWLTHWHAILKWLSILSGVVIGLVALAVVLLICNTLRFVIHCSGDDIYVLKLLGAENAYIARPFLYSGMWYGLFGALSAVILISGITLALETAAEAFFSDYAVNPFIPRLMVGQAYLIVGIAIVLGWLGARLFIKKQLASIEPCI